jgi:hypothetical protein
VIVADFDPFANQGGPAAWDPEHAGDAKQHAEELVRALADDETDEPGAGPSTFGQDETPDADAGSEFDTDSDEGAEPV